MSRWVVPKRPGLAAAAGDQPDGPLARVVKYVPAEIVTAYTLLFSALVTMNLPIGQSQRIVCGLIAVFFVVTIIYVAKNTTGKVRLGLLFAQHLQYRMRARPSEARRPLDRPARQIGQIRLERRRESHQHARRQLNVRAVLEIIEIAAVHAAALRQLVTRQAQLRTTMSNASREVAALARVHLHDGSSPSGDCP